jgi:ketosteroid isomerase-like protein
MNRVTAARAYYDALDGHDHEALADLLVADFVHDRPDRTIEGSESFVRFMREKRPNPDTSHELDGVAEAGDEVLVRGRLLDGGDLLVQFCDAFAFEDGRIARIVTYTN